MRKLIVVFVVVLAFAGGIAVGAGPLAENGGDGGSAPQARSSAKGSAATDLDTALAAAVAPTVLKGKLAAMPVAIVALPGSRAETVQGLASAVGAAGGTVASTTTLTDAVTAVGEKPMVEALGTQVLAQMPGVVDAALTTYPRFGALLGAALTTTGKTGAAGERATMLRETFSAGGFVSAPIQGPSAALTIVLAGTRVDDSIVTGLMAGLRTTARGLVVSGPSRSADIRALRSAELPIGTFDGSETSAGAIGAVLLLARQITSPGGSFGASGSDGTLPLG